MEIQEQKNINEGNEERNINDLFIDESPEKIISDFSSSMVANALENQLENLHLLNNETDFLTPFMKRVRLARKLDLSEDRREALDIAVNNILSSIVKFIEKNLNIQFNEHDLLIENGNFEDDVIELYNFAVSDRKEISLRFLENLILINRKYFADSYRKETDRKNQTVSHAKNLFVNYDDIIIWENFGNILNSIKSGEDFKFSLEDFLEVVGEKVNIPKDGYIDILSNSLTDENFGNYYLKPILTEEKIVETKHNLKERWIKICKNRYKKK